MGTPQKTTETTETETLVYKGHSPKRLILNNLHTSVQHMKFM